MVNNKKQIADGSDAPNRRRGRPAGKNRVPLSQEERRARNAQYERERRNETAEMMSQLIEAAECDPNISNADLLATVISRIQQANSDETENIEDIRRINAKLEAQIITLQNRLGLDDASFEALDSENNDSLIAAPHTSSEPFSNTNYHQDRQLKNQTRKRKRSQQSSSEIIQQEKRTKTRSETGSVDSGIDVRGSTESPPTVCTQDNVQYTIETVPQQLPVEILEEEDYDPTQSYYIGLQSELYKQIYNSESQSATRSKPEWNPASLLAQEPPPSMEDLSQLLSVVPHIVPPQQVPPDSQEQAQPVSIQSPINEEPPTDLNTPTECDYMQRNDDQQPNFDLLTDAEKTLLANWIDAEFLESSQFDNDTSASSYAMNNINNMAFSGLC